MFVEVNKRSWSVSWDWISVWSWLNGWIPISPILYAFLLGNLKIINHTTNATASVATPLSLSTRTKLLNPFHQSVNTADGGYLRPPTTSSKWNPIRKMGLCQNVETKPIFFLGDARSFAPPSLAQPPIQAQHAEKRHDNQEREREKSAFHNDHYHLDYINWWFDETRRADMTGAVIPIPVAIAWHRMRREFKNSIQFFSILLFTRNAHKQMIMILQNDIGRMVLFSSVALGLPSAHFALHWTIY